MNTDKTSTSFLFGIPEATAPERRAHEKAYEGTLSLRRMKDEKVDLTDIPALADWNRAVIGKFYRPVKKSVTIRVDADDLVRVKGMGKG